MGFVLKIDVMDFKELMTAPVIRKLPTKVKGALYLNAALVAGILITSIGIYIISTHSFKINHHVNKHYLEAEGEITDAWVAQQEDSENDAVIAYEYIFYNAEIGQYSGISYGTIVYPIGQPIVVRYDPFNPQYNRAANLRVSKAAPLNWLQASAILLVGLALLAYGLFIAIYRTMYLERGQITWAEKIKKQQRGEQTDIGSTHVYCYTDLEGKERYLSKDYNKDEFVRRRMPVIYLPDMTHEAKFPDNWRAIDAVSGYIMEQLN
ncbi:MAG: hypothetical protein Roseis2KO_18760 [Roseivirga sp.]